MQGGFQEWKRGIDFEIGIRFLFLIIWSFQKKKKMVGFYRFMEGGAAELVQIRQPCRLQWLQINGMEGFRGPWRKIKKKEEFGFLEFAGLFEGWSKMEVEGFLVYSIWLGVL